MEIADLFKHVLQCMNSVEHNKIPGWEKKDRVIKDVGKDIRQMFGNQGSSYLFLVEPIIEFIISLSKTEQVINLNKLAKKTLKQKLTSCVGVIAKGCTSETFDQKD